MKNWTIKTRIIAGFTAIMCLSALMGILAWNSLRTITGHADDLASDSIPGLSTGDDIMQNLSMAHLTLVRHVLTTNLDEKHADEVIINNIASTNAILI